MRFSDIVGHRDQKELLVRAARAGRVPNAYLFHGPEGVGKRTTALALYSYLVCKDPGGGDSCGECRSCNRVDDGFFVDLHVIEPEDGTLKIQALKDALGPLQYGAVEGAWKCLVVDDAHTMKIEAANAVLKTIEEPPDRTFFVLVTSSPDLLPETVLSRCLQVPFGPLPLADIQEFLVRRHGAEPALARDAAARSGGSMGKAVELLSSDALVERVNFLSAFMGLLGGPVTERLSFADDVARNRESPFMDLLGLLLSDLLKASAGLPDQYLANADLSDSIRAFAASVGPDSLARMADAYHEWDSSRAYRPSLKDAVDKIVLSF